MSKEAMKLALEALNDLIPANANIEEVRHKQSKAAAALREALAAQQEPWGAFVDGRVFVGRLPEHVRKFSENAEVPIQWLYTSPLAQRTWAGLTDEEQTEIMSEAREFVSRGLLDLVEAKLKEKNT